MYPKASVRASDRGSTVTNSSDPRIPESDVDAVLDRSIDLHASAEEAEGGVALSELQQAAREAGIPPEFVKQAAAQVSSRRAGRGEMKRWFGMGLCGFMLFVAGAVFLSNEESEDAVLRPPNAVPMSAPKLARKSPAKQVDEGPERLSRPSVADAILTGDAAADARRAVQGNWQLVSWVTAGEKGAEVPARQRADHEPSAELWDFTSGGRFRRTIGSDFAMGGRWTVVQALAAPASLQWLGIETWWLLALDGVQIASLPIDQRAREFALVGQDGDERIIVYLGREASVGKTVTGARCVRGKAGP